MLSMMSVTEIFAKINEIIFFTSWTPQAIVNSDFKKEKGQSVSNEVQKLWNYRKGRKSMGSFFKKKRYLNGF